MHPADLCEFKPSEMEICGRIDAGLHLTTQKKWFAACALCDAVQKGTKFSVQEQQVYQAFGFSRKVGSPGSTFDEETEMSCRKAAHTLGNLNEGAFCRLLSSMLRLVGMIVQGI
jgi:hypothetical protein